MSKVSKPLPQLCGSPRENPHTHTQGWASPGAGTPTQVEPGPLQLSIWFRADSCQGKGVCALSHVSFTTTCGFSTIIIPILQRRKQIQGSEVTCPKSLNQQARLPNHFSEPLLEPRFLLLTVHMGPEGQWQLWNLGWFLLPPHLGGSVFMGRARSQGRTGVTLQHGEEVMAHTYLGRAVCGSTAPFGSSG